MQFRKGHRRDFVANRGVAALIPHSPDWSAKRERLVGCLPGQCLMALHMREDARAMLAGLSVIAD
jgi:hypothetical protein